MTPKEELLLRSLQEFISSGGGYHTSSKAPIIGATQRVLQRYPALTPHTDSAICVLSKFLGAKAENEFTLGERVRLLREKLGYSQARLSSESRVLQQTVSQIESGKLSNPTAETLSGLSRALGVTLDELYHGT